jgi:hypothetical protein
MLFVVESFSKIDHKGYVWVILINLSNKEVLLADRMSGTPFGFGLRNYWAGSIHAILSDLKYKYKNWKKSYR